MEEADLFGPRANSRSRRVECEVVWWCVVADAIYMGQFRIHYMGILVDWACCTLTALIGVHIRWQWAGCGVARGHQDLPTWVSSSHQNGCLPQTHLHVL